MSGGFKRYNEIQKALSAQLKSEGKTLKGTGKKFHEVASGAYHKTKGQPLKQVLNNFDLILDDVLGRNADDKPELTSDQKSFFFFDMVSGNDVFEPSLQADNLLINSFFCHDKDIPAKEFRDYERNLKPFIAHCNQGKDIVWTDGYGPSLSMTDPVPHPTLKGFYVSDIVADDPDNYGFVLGEETELTMPEQEEAEPEPIEPEDKKDKGTKIEEAERKASERAVKIKQLEIESKKEDNRASELSIKKGDQNLAILKEYKELYKDGIITKADYRKKVMELKF